MRRKRRQHLLVVEFVAEFLPDLRGVALSFKALEQRTRVEPRSVLSRQFRPPDVFKARHSTEMYHKALDQVQN